MPHSGSDSTYPAVQISEATSICENKAGSKRNGGDAGIEHIIRKVAPEAMEGRTLQSLKQIRHRIAHGLIEVPLDELRADAESLTQELQISLLAGILTVVDRKTAGANSTPMSSAILPRDYKVRPDGRHTIVLDVELPETTPWYDLWIGLEWA